MPTNRSSKSGKVAGRRIRRAQPSETPASEVATGMMHLVTGTMRSALAGIQDVGAEVGGVAVTVAQGSLRAARTIGADVGRLAIEAAEGAIQAADRITAAAGRVANNLVGATVSSVTGRPAGGEPAIERGPGKSPRAASSRATNEPLRAQRKPLARSAQRSAARPASARRRRGAGPS